jgi:UrcA family protein
MNMNTGVLTATLFAVAASLPVAASTEMVSTTAPGAGTELQSVSIHYSRAELATDSGRTELYSRIRRAARKVCGPTEPRQAGGLALASRNRSCYQQAMEAAVRQVGAAQLAQTDG